MATAMVSMRGAPTKSRKRSLADLVTTRIRGVAGIRTSQTLIAFRAYSRHHLAALFDLD